LAPDRIAVLLGRPLCAVSPKNSAIHFEVFRPDVGSWSSPHGRLSWASALLQSSSRTTATTLASHRHFREVLRPYSVSNRARIALACPPTPSAFDVSTSVTGFERPRPAPRFLGASAHGVHPSKLFPLTLSRPLSRLEREPCPRRVSRPAVDLCPPAVSERASRRKIRGESHPIRLLGLAPSESPTTACDLRRTRSAAPVGFASGRISPSPLRARCHGPSAPGLALLLVSRRRLPLNVLLCGEVGFPSQRFLVPLEPLRSGCRPL